MSLAGGIARVRAQYHREVMRQRPPRGWQWYPWRQEATLACSRCDAALHLHTPSTSSRATAGPHAADSPGWWQRRSLRGWWRAEGVEQSGKEESEEEEEEEEEGEVVCCQCHARTLAEDPSSKSVRLVSSLTDIADVEVREQYASAFASRAEHHANVVRLQQLTVAFLVLKDPEKARIYDSHGYEGIVLSESYSENNLFDVDPFERHEAFFRGDDEVCVVLESILTICVTSVIFVRLYGPAHRYPFVSRAARESLF